MKVLITLPQQIVNDLDARTNDRYRNRTELVRHICLDYIEHTPRSVGNVPSVVSAGNVYTCDCMVRGVGQKVACALALADSNGTEAKDPCGCVCHQKQ